MTEKDCVLEVRNLSKSFGSKKVLEDINLSLRVGESIVVLGGSGSGKSVLLKCILGLLKPTAGNVYFHGSLSDAMSDIERKTFLDKFGMLFQGGALFDSLSICHNVVFRLLHGKKKISESQAREVAAQTLEKVGLSQDILDLYPSEISGGMQKRVGLARAIVTNPEVIFFDEPTSGLDPIMSTAISYLIKDIVKTMKAATITITHDLRSAMLVGDIFLVIKDGKLYWSGTSSEVMQCSDTYIRKFTSSLHNAVDDRGVYIG